ncbi:MAG: 3-isopropylmalate dehydratase small subunit [Acidobacteria bacterium]|nr:MAG: 3-isopropylmalate dehydratase small subunit [Acidobacteriota bacterium]RPJ63356.1 MAG: 3-isopropylmalate dehydratase small subunit [Acidobacteriota bacterium]
MEPFKTLSGIAAPLDRRNVDTDQIIPKQFLKRIERTGYGEFLFFDWRYLPDGSPSPDFGLNAAELKGASILVAGANFGCGSSREHAPWALHGYGFRCIIAPSFADIFYNNCFKNGILPIALPEGVVHELIQKARAQAPYRLTVDLEKQLISDEQGLNTKFEVDPFRRHCLLYGLDDIGLTLQHEAQICAYEERMGK